jgi:hypothetical protein
MSDFHRYFEFETIVNGGIQGDSEISLEKNVEYEGGYPSQKLILRK